MSYRIRIAPMLSLALLTLGSLLFPSTPCARQEHFTVSIEAGQSYPLSELGQTSVPQVSYADNRHAFMLECLTPAGSEATAAKETAGAARSGYCYLLGVEAGHGSVRGVSAAGVDVVYDVTVSAVARPGHPLEPGVAPSIDYGGKAAGATADPGLGENPVVKEIEAAHPAAGATSYPRPSTLVLMAGSSQLVNSAVPLRRVAIADNAVADVQVISPNQVMVVGHKAGFTTLVTWDDSGNYREQVVRIDEGGPQEVQLNVVMAELNRTKLEEQGVDISVALANAGVSVTGLPGEVGTPYNPNTNLTASGGAGTVVPLPPQGVLPLGGSLIPLLLSSSLTYGVATNNGQARTNTFIQLLEQHDLVKILAEPRLLAESGQEARFLSGGEIPIVIAQALNTSIVFKQFGTSVRFLPTVIDSNQGEIELYVRPEFSEPDYSQGVQLFGFTVPAFITRRAESKVRLRENQTLIIAGLILDTDRSELRKVPYLGDLPFLGTLFRHTYWNHTKSELLMTVIPRIVQPIAAGIQVALPVKRGPMTREEVRTSPLEQPDVTRPRLR